LSTRIRKLKKDLGAPLIKEVEGGRRRLLAAATPR
jgi:hypothetical protein